MKSTFKILHVLSALFVIAVGLAAIGVPDLFGAIGMGLAFPLVLANYETSDDAKQKRSDIWDQMQQMVELRKTHNRSFTADENTKYDQLKKDFDTLSAHIKELEEDEKRAAQMAGVYLRDQQNSKKDSNNNHGWFDQKTGNPVKVYTRSEKITDSLPLDKRNLSLGRLIQSHLTGNADIAQAERRSFIGMSTAELSAGASVPIQLWGNVLDLARSLSIVGRARGVQLAQMTSKKMTIARFQSDVAMEVKAENEKFSLVPAPMDGIDVEAYTIGAIVPVSRELALDSPNFVTALEFSIAAALAKKLDELVLFGAGTTEPLGIANTPFVHDITGGDTLNYDHLIQAWTAITFSNGEPTSLFMNPRDLAALTQGSRTDLGFIEHPQMLRNIDFLHSSALPATFGITETLSKAVLGDFSGLLVAIRDNATIEVSTTGGESFERHQALIKIVWRGDSVVLRPTFFAVIDELEAYVPPVEGGEG